uniref:Phospholipid scramblase n=1 Tax=Glossina brevipalpis TaxID=37001 RepID=A0A1A9W564_9MUSC
MLRSILPNIYMGFGQSHGYAPVPQMPYSREVNQPQQIPQPLGMQQFYSNGVGGQLQPGYAPFPGPIVTQPGASAVVGQPTAQAVGNFKSTLELTSTPVNSHDNKRKETENKTSTVLRLVWNILHEKCEYLYRKSQFLKNAINRESNKPLAKQFRKSLRLNKSAKKKGYKYFLSDEDKRVNVILCELEISVSDWMIMPAGIPNCPRGLEYLTTVDQLLVKQKVELLEALTGFETNNKFSIKNALGQKVYYAVEENDCCTRNMCGPARPFDMKIFDNFRNEVIHMHRPLACSSCLCMCCLQSIEVTAPPGNVIGSVEQEWSICTPSFRIKNQLDEVVLRIEGPICTFSLCGEVEFNILSLTGENIGKISKQWSGLAREIFTDADFFGIIFPLDLDVRMKAVLLGATFLIDAMFFEKSGNRETDRPGML